MLMKIKNRISGKSKRFIEWIDNLIYNIPTNSKKTSESLLSDLINRGIVNAVNFDFKKLREETIGYVKKMQVGESVIKYKFCKSQSKDNLYASVYACLIYGMYGELDNLSPKQKEGWIEYFNSFQNEKDGLWYDSSLHNEYYDDSDWWGARHLAVQIIAAYEALEALPKYKISYVEKYYDREYTLSWLNSFDWNNYFTHKNDIDNKIMNIVAILQYNRDKFNDDKARITIENIFSFLDSKINKVTALWGGCNISDEEEVSRVVQFGYHLLVLYFYDKVEVKAKKSIVEITLKTQNIFGGYGVKLNSSACEDIDSIELLVNLSEKENREVKSSLKKALAWVLSNQDNDGGFVFRKNEKMWYGHDILTARENESHLFATWFRTLSILKIVKYLNLDNEFKYIEIPGY